MTLHDGEEVIACLLTERDAAIRAEQAREELFPGLLAVEELADGYGYKFPADGEWIARVMAVADAERQCCPFFKIEVVIEPHGRGLWLRFRGSAAIKAFVRDAFPLAPPTMRGSQRAPSVIGWDESE
jgi:hypothetical protein